MEISTYRELSQPMLVESSVPGKYAHLDPRKYPLEIFFFHGHFSADLKIFFIHGNKWFNTTMKQHSHQLSQHDVSFCSSFLMEITFFIIAETNAQPGPMKQVFLWILCLRQRDIRYFPEHLSVKTMYYTQPPTKPWRVLKVYLRFESTVCTVALFCCTSLNMDSEKPLESF